MTTAPVAVLVEDERESTALDFGAGQDLEVQITTARKFPRSIKLFIDRALEMATLDEETAKACFYALPRDGKRINGPSARLAEICAAAYGHLRVGAKVVREDDKWVYSVGAAWDVEANVAITFEVRRRIVDSKGRRYSDDMVGVTGNAASSIALRNAIFKIIPSAFWRPIYERCRKVAVGDAKTLAGRRSAMLEHFQKTMAVDPARVFAALGVKGVEDITLEHLEQMIGISNAIKEGDTTVEEAFAAQPVEMPQRASEQRQTAAAAPVTTPANGDGPIPDGADRIIELVKHPHSKVGSWWVVKTARGVQAFTMDQALGATLEAANVGKRFVTLGWIPTAEAQGHRLTTIALVPGEPQ
jgi:hypothetical protein